jgi:DNA primase
LEVLINLDAVEIKQYLNDNTEKLITLLETIGLHNILVNTDCITCSRDEEGGGKSTRIKLNQYLNVDDYKRGLKGDIFLLVGNCLGGLTFVESFKYISKFLGTKADFNKSERKDIFGGFFHKSHIKEFDKPKTYPIEILKQYERVTIDLFLKEGISSDTQDIFNIGYDWNTHRISIPEYNFEGELIGVSGRWNGESYKTLDISKYYPIIEFPKQETLYGYHINYYNLLNNNIFLGEPQKGVLKMHSQQVFNVLGLGGKVIHQPQIIALQSLNPKSIILGLDEGVSEEEIIAECDKLKSQSSFLKYKVGYLYDPENKYLIKGSKDSPFDLKVDKLREMTKQCVKWR